MQQNVVIFNYLNLLFETFSCIYLCLKKRVEIWTISYFSIYLVAYKFFREKKKMAKLVSSSHLTDVIFIVSSNRKNANL